MLKHILRNKNDIVSYLENVLENINLLGFKKTEVYLSKISLLRELLARIEAREFPDFSKDDNWQYELGFSNFGIYLKMTMRSPGSATCGPNDVLSYKLIKMTSPYLSISDYAKKHSCSENTVRQRLKRGQFLYARFEQTWFLPEWSIPQDDLQLKNGRFYVFQTPEEQFKTSLNTTIEISDSDRILIVEQPRNSKNEKYFKVLIEKYDHINRAATNKREYILNPIDKQKFVFYLVKTSHIDFWGDSLQLGQWLAD